MNYRTHKFERYTNLERKQRQEDLKFDASWGKGTEMYFKNKIKAKGLGV
jgi:hypothetical protein